MRTRDCIPVAIASVAIGIFAGGHIINYRAHILNKNKWECIAIKPATEVGQKAECVAYRSTDVEWSR